MLWACILLPQLAMDGILRHRSDPDAPLVLLSGPPHKRVLQAVNPAARARGLKPGQSLTAAQALSNDFATAPYDLTAIERWQHFLAAWAYRYSAQVSLHYPRCLLLEVRSSLRLFGPWSSLQKQLREELTALGFQHRITAAPNPAAARVLANVHDDLIVTDPGALEKILATIPVEHLGLSREITTALSRMGLRQLRHLLALPRASLGKRFPTGLMPHLDTLLGRRSLALDFYRPPDVFDERIELNAEVNSHQALLFPLQHLLSDMAIYLAGRDSGVQRFMVHLEHRPGSDQRLPPTQVPIGLLTPEREAARLLELTRGRLERVALPAPVIALRLIARELPTFAPQGAQLFDEKRENSLPWEQLRERLRARLGDSAVQGLSAVADHRPERAWQPHETHRLTPLPSTGLRPGWLLAEPRPLHTSQIHILAGPERIESGWWDGGDVRRDYYVIETRTGQRGWAYRPAGGEPDTLLLHGWFG